MKRYGWLYEKAFTKENIKEAIHKASQNKRKRKIVIKVLANEDYYVDKIYEMMWSFNYIPSPYSKFTIIDNGSKKVRELSKPKFYPDHIVHWCIYLILYPILSKSLVPNTYSCLKGRGQIYGKNKIKKQLKNKKATKYYLKVDIKKFYPSININKLIEMLEKRIKDVKMMNLISSILKLENGLPIGMILSQLFANYYLHKVDMMFNSKYYNRYADDVVIFSSNKRKLHKIRKQLQNELSKLDLSLKPNYQVYRTSKEKLDYMGFRFGYDYVILRKRILYALNRSVINWYKRKDYLSACQITSYMGWVKHSNSYCLYQSRIKPYVNFKEIKEIQRRRQNENLCC